jgi:hypothetical protein
MYTVCRHIKMNGLRCKSPALKGGNFCYFHSKLHAVGAEPNLKYGPIQLPPPEDIASIQLSIARINDAIINGRIDLKKAAVLLYGIQIAAQFIDRKQKFHEERTVQTVEQSPQGDDLAPDEYVCNEDDECCECPYATPGQCTRWRYVEPTNPEDDNENAIAGEDCEDDAGQSPMRPATASTVPIALSSSIVTCVGELHLE